MVDSSFMNYAGGIYSPTTCTTATNHIMLLTGYDTSGPVPFWIIKNSWGEVGLMNRSTLCIGINK